MAKTERKPRARDQAEGSQLCKKFQVNFLPGQIKRQETAPWSDGEERLLTLRKMTAGQSPWLEAPSSSQSATQGSGSAEVARGGWHPGQRHSGDGVSPRGSQEAALPGISSRRQTCSWAKDSSTPVSVWSLPPSSAPGQGLDRSTRGKAKPQDPGCWPSCLSYLPNKSREPSAGRQQW